MKEINAKALLRLKAYRDRLSWQQYRTLRGQVLSGDHEAAMRGLKTILERTGAHEPRNQTTESDYRGTVSERLRCT